MVLGSDRAVIDGHVIGQPWALEAIGNQLTGIAERLHQERADIVHGVERPEAVQNPDLEPATQERAVAAAPGPVLRSIAVQQGNVVTTVVMDHQQSTAGSQDPLGLGDIVRCLAAERRPAGNDRVRRCIRRLEWLLPGGIDDGHARAEVGELSRTDPGRPIDEHDVPPPYRSERLKSPRDLALHVEGACEPVRQGGAQVQRKVCHETGIIRANAPRVGRGRRAAVVARGGIS